MGRTRLPRNSQFNGLPVYAAVVDGKVYYRFKDPVTRRFRGLGSDPAVAKRAAARIMLDVRNDPVETLVRKIRGGTKTVAEAIEEFHKHLAARTNKRGVALSESTLRDYRNMLERFERDKGGQEVRRIGLGDIADFLAPIPGRQAVMLRGVLSQLWTFAVARGWADDNVVEKTLKPPTKRLRKRLTKSDYDAIRAKGQVWFQNAADVALYSLQRREDLVHWPRGAWNKETGELAVTQSKTGKALLITAGAELRRSIEACLEGNAVTIVHQGGQPISPDDFTAAFADARDALPKYRAMAPRTRPSLHELRSLGAAMFLWKCRDLDLVQSLLGHTTKKQTLDYLQGHELPPEAVESS